MATRAKQSRYSRPPPPGVRRLLTGEIRRIFEVENNFINILRPSPLC